MLCSRPSLVWVFAFFDGDVVPGDAMEHFPTMLWFRTGSAEKEWVEESENYI